MRAPIHATSPFLAIAALVSAMLVLSAALAGEENVVPVGFGYTLELEGNPSTGYIWRLDAAKSENPSVLEVKDRGYAEPEPTPGKKPRVGAPASYHFLITAARLGRAKLVFEYVQPWVGKPAETEEHVVRVVAP